MIRTHSNGLYRVLPRVFRSAALNFYGLVRSKG